MLTVRVQGRVEATWDMESCQWLCEDHQVEEMLNYSVPKDKLDTHSCFLEGGTQALALKAAQDLFKEGLIILIDTPPPIPDEVPGMEY